MVTIEVKDEIINLRKDGLSYKEIHDKLNVSKSTISDILRPLGLGGCVYKKLTNELTKEIQAKYDEIGNIKVVSKLYHISVNRLSKVIVYKHGKNVSLSDAVKSWRKRTKEKLVAYKGGKCQICGYSKCIEALEFHHVNPNSKSFTISSKSKSFEVLKNEVDKCILVCSNCHKEIHSHLIDLSEINL